MSAIISTISTPGLLHTHNILQHTSDVSPVQQITALFRRSQRHAILFGIVGLAILGASVRTGAPPKLIWNASASAPLGLYELRAERPGRDDFVLARPPSAARELAAKRGYLPASVPMVKRIAAANGDHVCALGNAITINGIRVALRLVRDHRLRPLPAWSGCRDLGSSDVFLLMENVPDSFDGRYFGITQRTSVIGKLVPLWID
jgi:conjugative transfer signal peptidase TraF